MPPKNCPRFNLTKMFSDDLASVNPFGIINERLSSIEQTLTKLLEKSNPSTTVVDDEQWMETEQAAAYIHLSVDRLYVIHKYFFNARKPGGKGLLFSKRELDQYITGTLKQQKSKPAKIKNAA